MSVRWMAVQYLGNTLRLPVTNECDPHKPFGVSKLERDVERIIVNPFSDARRTFVPVDANMEQENERLQNRLELLLTILREDCDLNVSWDGLRGFWNVELTEGGCLMRDRACKAEAENANLRELVRKYGEYLDQDRCEGCVCKSRCNDGYIDECWQLTEIRKLASELEIEVNK